MDGGGAVWSVTKTSRVLLLGFARQGVPVTQIDDKFGLRGRNGLLSWTFIRWSFSALDGAWSYCLCRLYHYGWQRGAGHVDMHS